MDIQFSLVMLSGQARIRKQKAEYWKGYMWCICKKARELRGLVSGVDWKGSEFRRVLCS